MNVANLSRVHFPNVKKKNIEFEKGEEASLHVSEWECSKEYESVMKIIGKNRKVLISMFDDLKERGIEVNFEKAKEIIANILKSSGNFLSTEKWPYLLKFAQKEGIIDYKFLLEIFKERLYLLNAHPKSLV